MSTDFLAKELRAPPAGGPRWVSQVDTALGLLVAVPAAFLVLADIVVLFAGVVARYAFHSPLLWSDELASIMFLWLAMLAGTSAP